MSVSVIIPKEQFDRMESDLKDLEVYRNKPVEEIISSGVERYLLAIARHVEGQTSVNPEQIANMMRKQASIVTTTLWKSCGK